MRIFFQKHLVYTLLPLGGLADGRMQQPCGVTFPRAAIILKAGSKQKSPMTLAPKTCIEPRESRTHE
jgi:hypothetical protein